MRRTIAGWEIVLLGLIENGFNSMIGVFTSILAISGGLSVNKGIFWLKSLVLSESEIIRLSLNFFFNFLDNQASLVDRKNFCRENFS